MRRNWDLNFLLKRKKKRKKIFEIENWWFSGRLLKNNCGVVSPLLNDVVHIRMALSFWRSDLYFFFLNLRIKSDIQIKPSNKQKEHLPLRSFPLTYAVGWWVDKILKNNCFRGLFFHESFLSILICFAFLKKKNELKNQMKSRTLYICCVRQGKIFAFSCADVFILSFQQPPLGSAIIKQNINARQTFLARLHFIREFR